MFVSAYGSEKVLTRLEKVGEGWRRQKVQKVGEGWRRLEEVGEDREGIGSRGGLLIENPLLTSQTLEILRTPWEILTPRNYHPEPSDLDHIL